MNAWAEPLDKRGLAEDVADRLRVAILAGEIPVGARLYEVELSNQLKVSRGPVRDALQLLRHEGLLESRWHKGAFVRRLTREDADEIYSLRASIECLAVQRVIDRGQPGDMELLTQQAKAVETAALKGSQAEMLQADIAFHEAIYRAAHHERLLQTWLGMRSQIALLLLDRQGADSDYRHQIAREHWEIREAIVDRDLPAAQALVRGHIEDAGARVIARLEGGHAAGAPDCAGTPARLKV